MRRSVITLGDWAVVLVVLGVLCVVFQRPRSDFVEAVMLRRLMAEEAKYWDGDSFRNLRYVGPARGKK